MDRAEHLEWAKKRALEYVDRGEIEQAVNSMISDLGKHPDTERSVKVAVMIMLTVRDVPSARRFVEGFN